MSVVANRQGRRGLVLLGWASLLFSVLCVGAAAYLTRHAKPEPPTPSLPRGAAVLQGTIQRPSTAAEQRAADQGRLHAYGWVDAGHTRVHIPIDVAMDVWLAQQGGSP